MNKNCLRVGLDLGSYEFKLVVAYLDDNHQLKLVSMYTHPSQGIKKGSVLNMESCVTSLKELFQHAEMDMGFNISGLYISYSSENIEAVNSHGVAATGIRGRGRIITKHDKEQVISAAQAIVIPQDREITHIFPIRYVVDNQELVKDPLNMVGVRLEAEAHIIITPTTLLEHLNLAIVRTGKQVINFLYSSIGLCEAILSKEEKELGAVVIDLGFNTTKISYYQHGCPYYNYVLPIGSHALTTDLAYMLQIPDRLAEKIKQEQGCAYKPLLSHEDFTYLPGSGHRNPESVRLTYICDILTARLTDMYNIIYTELSRNGWLERTCSIVLGGGGSRLPGATELASRIFGLSVRSGYSMGVENLEEKNRDARYSSALGLIKYYRSAPQKWESTSKKNNLLSKSKECSGFCDEKIQKGTNIFQWIRDFF